MIGPSFHANLGRFAMWILLVPLIIAEVAFWLFLAFVAWRAFTAWRTGSAAAMGVWLAIIAAPFVLYAVELIRADMREATRAREVANFERHPFPASYPRRLEVEGSLNDAERLIYLDALDIDEIVVFQSRPHKGMRSASIIRLAPGCGGRGRELLAAWHARRKLANARSANKACLIETRTKIPADTDGTPAIRLLMDRFTTLGLPGTRWSSGNYEARLRTHDGDILLDYWERPYLPRPAGPGPWGYAYQSNTDWKDYRNPARIDFFGRALGLIAPAVSSSS